ncbi:MAG: hypothetical protein IJQ13_05710 [Prevotella sp.]|nr:hypothetical protein [Prevotella sp.]
MKTKRTYEKPSMKVFELRQQPQLLAGSGEGGSMPNPDDYGNGGDGFTW